MPDSGDIQQVAEILRNRLGNDDFLTVQRAEVTELVRTVSGEGATRVGHRMSEKIEQRLGRLGIRTHPPLADTSNDLVRLFPAGGPVDRLVEVVAEPGRTDQELAGYIGRLNP